MKMCQLMKVLDDELLVTITIDGGIAASGLVGNMRDKMQEYRKAKVTLIEKYDDDMDIYIEGVSKHDHRREDHRERG